MNAPIENRFALVDHHGRPVTEATYRGRMLLIYFGFTHCRVVCPRSLGKLSAVLEALGPAAAAITPLYITVDPARDTPEVMKTYLETSFPRFTGLSGSAEEIDAAKRAFRIFAQRKENPKDPEGYDMPHTAISYLIAPDGQYLAHFIDGVEAQVIAEKLGTLLGQAA